MGVIFNSQLELLDRAVRLPDDIYSLKEPNLFFLNCNYDYDAYLYTRKKQYKNSFTEIFHGKKHVKTELPA